MREQYGRARSSEGTHPPSGQEQSSGLSPIFPDPQQVKLIMMIMMMMMGDDDDGFDGRGNNGT